MLNYEEYFLLDNFTISRLKLKFKNSNSIGDKTHTNLSIEIFEIELFKALCLKNKKNDDKT